MGTARGPRPRRRDAARSGWARWSASSTATGRRPGAVRADGRRPASGSASSSATGRCRRGSCSTGSTHGLARLGDRLATLDAAERARASASHPRRGEMTVADIARAVRAWATPRTTSPSSRTILADAAPTGAARCSSSTRSRSGSLAGLPAGRSARAAGRAPLPLGAGWRSPGWSSRSSCSRPGRRLVGGASGRRSTSPRPRLVLAAVLAQLRDPGAGARRASAPLATSPRSWPTAAYMPARRRPWRLGRPRRATGFTNSIVIADPALAPADRHLRAAGLAAVRQRVQHRRRADRRSGSRRRSPWRCARDPASRRPPERPPQPVPAGRAGDAASTPARLVPVAIGLRPRAISSDPDRQRYVASPQRQGGSSECEGTTR